MTPTTPNNQQKEIGVTDTFEVVVIEPGGEYRVEQLTHGCEPLQRIVGGYIEAVYSEDREVTFWCNEEGKLIGLEPNPVATMTWYRANPGYRIDDFLCGTVVISGGADSKGDTLGIPAAYRDGLLALLEAA